MNAISIGLLAIAVRLATGATGEAEFRPTAAEAGVPALFRLEPAKFKYEKELIYRAAKYEVFAVRFPSPIETRDAVNNTVHAEYFRPLGAEKRPAVIVLHILAGDFALSRYIAARLADRGVAAMFVKMPYYGERRPPGVSRAMLSVDVERSLNSLKQGVCDVRRAAAWLACQNEVDANRLGVTGISLGGIISALSVAIDPAINRGVFLLAGGGLADIFYAMPEAARLREMWEMAGKSKADLVELTRPIDPLTYAERLVGKRVLMMAGNSDEVVPPSCARALWMKAGRPPIRWLDCGHYSAISYLLPALRQTVEFFERE